jgi:hypothetical protein
MLRQTNRIPVIIHGLRNYDSHFLIRELATLGYANNVRIVPINSESYLSFSLRIAVAAPHENELLISGTTNPVVTLVFLDSYAFLSRSLAELGENLPSEDFSIIREEIEIARTSNETGGWQHMLKRSDSDSEAIVQLLKRKGCFCYDRAESLDFFNEKSLPAKASFHSFLTDEDVSDVDYEHAQQIWAEFKMKDMGMYSDFYLMTDVLLLACVFEAFRNISIRSTGIDPSHHLSTPGFTWDACLKETGIELECINDPDMYLMIEKGIRGGLSQISLRYATANNAKASGDDYDPSRETSWIMYYDFVNLYDKHGCKHISIYEQ